jgi:hypothetical protein
MRRLIPFLLLASGSLMAQTPVGPGQVGTMYCMAVQRAVCVLPPANCPPAQVQTYCYQYPANPTWVLVHNSIDSLPASGGSLTVSFNWASDLITWYFVLSGPGDGGGTVTAPAALEWEYTADQDPIQYGIFGPLTSAACVSTLCTVYTDAYGADMMVGIGAYPAGVSGPSSLVILAGSTTAQFTIVFAGTPVVVSPTVTNWNYGALPGSNMLYTPGPNFQPTVWMGGVN